MENDHISYYSLNIHPSQINVYYQSLNGYGRRNLNNNDSDDLPSTLIKQPSQFKDNYHNGRISNIAKRKMSKAIDYMYYIAKPKVMPDSYYGKNYSFKLNFITLNLSSDQIHTDQEIKDQLLNQFLIEMTKRWGVKMYLWRAEKQENGRIHFHIITDQFIPWNELRNVWNRIQQKLGYVTRYREDRLKWHKDGFKYAKQYAPRWPYRKQLEAYKVGTQTGWENPNSIDVHSLRFINNIKAYIVKYISKNKEYTENEKASFNELTDLEKDAIKGKGIVSGRLWSCSNNLTNLQGGNTDCDGYIYDELKRLRDHNPDKVYVSDYFIVHSIDIDLLKELDCVHLLACFESFIRQRFPDNYLHAIR